MMEAVRKTLEPPKPRIRGVPAVSRALAILRFLGNAAEPVNLKAIASSLSLVPSTCLHILRVLVAEDLVRVDEQTKRYTLSSGMLSLVQSVIRQSTFTTLIQPTLDRLAEAWGVTTAGVEIQDSEHLALVAISRSRLPFALHIDVGLRFPLLASASGRLIAAYGDQNWPELRRRFKSLQWDKPMAFADWKRAVELSRKKGFSVDRGQSYPGVTIVAVPLFNASGRLMHTAIAMGLSGHLNGSRIKGLASDMLQEARRLSTLIIQKA